MSEEKTEMHDLFNSSSQIAKDGEIDCKKCGNMRMFAYEKDGYEFFKSCECVEVMKSKQRITKSGLENMMKDYRFDNFQTSKPFQKFIKEKAIDFVNNTGKNWLVILGQSGAGKTHICTAVCGELLKQGKTVGYARWAVELKRMKMHGGGSEDYDFELRKLLANDVIYIDDLFKRAIGAKPSNPDIQMVFEIVDTCLALNKVLIISGEDTIEKLFTIDEATAGRIRQKARQFLLTIEKGFDKNYRAGGEHD